MKIGKNNMYLCRGVPSTSEKWLTIGYILLKIE